MSDIEVYVNEKQREVLETPHKRRAFVGGRASGKTTVIGDYCMDCIELLPKSWGGLWAPTKEVLWDSTVPEVTARWEVYGLEENVDFVIGKRPPDDFDRPYKTPKKYDNVISLANGTVVIMIGLFTERAGRGLSLQWGAGDEMGFIKGSRFTQAISPAMRGNRFKVVTHILEGPEEVPFGKVQEINGVWYWKYFYEECHLYMSHLNVTSMPYLDYGKWILKYEDMKDTCYVESTAYDNIHVLSQAYIDNLKETLDPWEFAVEVMNERVDKLPDGFYPDWDDEVHTTMENLYDPRQPLDISLDFGRFNGLTVWQERNGIAACIDAIHVNNGTVIDLMNIFLKRYGNHSNKRIDLYGDRNGNNFLPNSPLTLYQEIEQKLEDKGWIVFNTVRGLDLAHAEKHLFMNKVLREEEQESLPKVRIHAKRCKNMIISIKKAAAKEDLKKNKASENPKSGVLPEHATHYSDTFDNYIGKKYKGLGSPAW